MLMISQRICQHTHRESKFPQNPSRSQLANVLLRPNNSYFGHCRPESISHSHSPLPAAQDNIWTNGCGCITVTADLWTLKLKFHVEILCHEIFFIEKKMWVFVHLGTYNSQIIMDNDARAARASNGQARFGSANITFISFNHLTNHFLNYLGISSLPWT